MLPLDISANEQITPNRVAVRREKIIRRCPQELQISEHKESSEVLWYPVRVPYCRELKLKSILDSLGVESYLPMKYVEKVVGNHKQRSLEPAIHNLLFVHASRDFLQSAKTRLERSVPFRYIMDKSDKKPLSVPQKQMEDFIRVTSTESEELIYLENPSFASKVGETVIIKYGVFEGVEGKILRIKNNRKVVVEIEGLAAVAIAYIPSLFIQRTEPK